MKKQLQIFSITITCLLVAGVNNLWSTDVHKTGCVNIVLSDTLPPVDNSNVENSFKNKYQYNKDGKTSQIETKEYIFKIEYDTRCNKQIRTTRISKSTGDSTWYTYTYDASCQLDMGESSGGIKLGFKFDSQQRLITIIQSSRKINIVYNYSGLPQKISLGNRDYVNKIYDSTGKILNRGDYDKYSWWHAPVGTYRVLRIMSHIIDDAETLFDQLLKFNPGLNMAEISRLFSRLAQRPLFIDM